MLNILSEPIKRLRRLCSRLPDAGAVSVIRPTPTPCAACGHDSLEIGHSVLDDELLAQITQSMIGRWFHDQSDDRPAKHFRSVGVAFAG